MRAAAIVLSIALVIGVALAAADEHDPLRAAELELKIARQHLLGAGHEYAGHRQAAVDHVNQALQEVRAALSAVKTHGPKAKPDQPAPDKDQDEDLD